MKQLQLKSAKNQQFNNVKKTIFNNNVLKKHELKQIKGGTEGGEEDDGAISEIMDWV